MTDKEKIRKEVERIQLYTQSEVLKQVLDYIDRVQEEPVSEDLEEAAKLHVIETRCEDVVWDENAKCAMLDFKAGTKWQKAKDESKTEDLGEYINELSKQFPEVSFAKLSRIAVRVAKWMMKDAVEETVDIDSNGLACVNVNDDDIMIGDTVKVLIKKGCKQ